MVKEMVPSLDEIETAAYEGNLERIRILARRGVNLNGIIGPTGETLLEEVISNLCAEDKPYRYDVVMALLDLGVDPNVLGEEKSSPLTPAMLHMDTEMLCILLEAGADPNKVSGHTETESFYDWAEFDYTYEMYDFKLPEEPTETDKADADAWLCFLDRVAIKYNMRRPDHLFLLRKYGAKGIDEMEGAA